MYLTTPTNRKGNTDLDARCEWNICGGTQASPELLIGTQDGVIKSHLRRHNGRDEDRWNHG
eukprot:9480921-Pyramimonas_sp.AAC.1